MTFTFDETLGLTNRGDNCFVGHTDQRYWNMIGPFGGWIAALMLKSVMQDIEEGGFEPVALTVDFMKAPGEGALVIRRTCDRQGRTAAFWRIDMETPDGKLCARAMLTLAPYRETLEFSARRDANISDPTSFELSNSRMLPIKWAHLYETRVVSGHLGATNPEARSQAWIRDVERRPLDHLSLTAICDSPFPRLFLATGTPSNISTITMTTYFHASMAELRQIGDAYILAESRCERSVGGFYDQHSNFHAADGRLLAASQQMVWYDRKA